MLEREGQQGKILIREGRVIQTVSPRTGTTLGELLVSRGLIAPDDLNRALELQGVGDSWELLGVILVRLGLVDDAILEKIVQEQIEDAIVYFLSWKEGTFSFELADIKSRGEFSVDPQAFILERGIDTQWLVLEGTRLMDERSRERGAPAAAAPAAEPGGETSFAGLDEGPEPQGGGVPLVLVDDDAAFRAELAGRLGGRSFRIIACDGVAAGLRGDRAGGRSRARPRPAACIKPPGIFLGLYSDRTDDRDRDSGHPAGLIAVPTYSKYIREARRAEAQSEMLQIRLGLEKCQANNNTYSSNLADAGFTDNNDYYNYTIPGTSGSAYTINATAVVGKSQVNDKTGSGTSCTPMTLNQSGTKTPAGCWKK